MSGQRHEGLVPVRPDLAEVTPYGAPQLDVPVRLNTNETAHPPPEGFLDAVAERLHHLELNRYPDRDHRALREALARRLDLATEQVWAANGSNEVLLQLLQAYGGPGRRVLSVRPGYSMYPELCRTTLTEHHVIALGKDGQPAAEAVQAALTSIDPDVVIVPSPNNPLGTLLDHATIRALHDDSRALVVVDEAYVEFAPEGASVLPMLAELERLVIVRTFSKAFRLAGLRLGYLAGPAWVVDDLQRVRLPYHLDALTQVAGLVALEQEPAFLDHRAQVVAERERIVAALTARGDVELTPSAANFLLLRTDRLDLFDRLLEHGVLVRDVAGSARLEGAVRVTVGTADENDAFLAALAAVLDADGEGPSRDAQWAAVASGPATDRRTV